MIRSLVTIVEAFLVAGVTFRRLATWRTAATAAVGGLLAGLVVAAVPSPALARDVLPVLVATVAALLVLPQVAALPTGDRRGGYEQLQGVRPVRSLPWAAGRTAGSVVLGVAVMLVVAYAAHLVAGSRDVPESVEGRAVDSVAGGETWRFALPAGSRGPFAMTVSTLVPFVGAGTLEVRSRRSGDEHVQELAVYPVRRHEVLVPDHAPNRGDLYVTLTPGRGVVLGDRPPTLEVGTAPLVGAQPVLPRGVLARLLFALLVVLAAAHAFRFETACLAGVLGLAVRPPHEAWAWAASAALLLVFSAVGTALVRRSALP